MPKIKRDEYELQEGQRRWPILWKQTAALAAVPDTSTEMLELACGPGKSKRVKSWGHNGPLSAHWLVTRGGLGLHTDASYARYTHHLVLRNDGFRIIGWDDSWIDALLPGSYYCLDTHSPHAVVNDPRIKENGPYKVQIAVDSEQSLDAEEVWAACSAMLTMDPRDGIEDVKRAPPRTGKKANKFGIVE